MLTTEDGTLAGTKEAAIFRKGTGKVLHIMKWSRHDILNRVRELSRFMSNPTNVHIQRLYRVLNYVRNTAEYGNYINKT
jgi:hypothetical protein